MKRLVCSQLMLVILFVLQSTQPLQTFVNSLEYSVEERIYIVKSLVREQQQQQQQHALAEHSQQTPQTPEELHHNYRHQIKEEPSKLYNNIHHHHQQQQQQQQPQHQHQLDDSLEGHNNYNNHQQNQLIFLEQQQQSLAESMQQVLLDTSRQQHQYQYTQIEWKHESNNQGEMNEFYFNNIESSYPSLSHAQDQLTTYYQYHHHHQQQQQQQQQQQRHYHHHEEHLIYTGQFNGDHDFDLINNNFARSSESCDSQHTSHILMQNNLKEATCKASTNSKNFGDSAGASVVPDFSQLTNKPSQNSNTVSFPLAPHQYHYESSLISAIRHYWREVSGLCLASAIFLNWLFVVIKRKLFIASGLSRAEHAIETIQQQQQSTRSVSKDTNSSSAHDSAFEDLACPMSLEDVDSSKGSSLCQDNLLIDDHKTNTTIATSLPSSTITTLNISSNIRQRSSTLKGRPTESIPIPEQNNIHQSNTPSHNSLSTSLSNSLNTSEYNSRYSSDFDSIQRLGRGGFGIVFEARNKIDDCHYAVKRICLPLEKEARERVMREVRALAKLDHAGIVRYYNAWLETPPDEWLKQHDAQLGINNSKDGMSFPSTDGIYDRNESEHMTKGGSGCKLAESGDNSSGLFVNNCPYKRRQNGFRRFLKNNSSSPSLDIVFEGSGSIRLESENNTAKTDSSQDETEYNKKKNGDIISDSEDSDFIQFESKINNKKNKKKDKNADSVNDDDYSLAGHLTDPFSSSSDSEADEYFQKDNIAKKPVNLDLRKNALNYQKELRQLNNVSLVENLHVEKVYLYIQMQLCRKDTLKDWLKTNCDNRDKTTIFDLFYQIVDAVEYVHSQDLIHRDLKPSNIFFSLDGTLKIGDFGLCRAKTSTGIGSSLDLQEYVAESEVERGFEAVHTEQVGTQLYMSPEQLNGLSYNQKVDIFAMGLILLELLVPFKTQMQRVNVLFKARNNLYSDEFKAEHPNEHELVKSLLNRSPLKRPTATEIKQHDLLSSAQLSQPVIERLYHRRRTISSSNSSTE